MSLLLTVLVILLIPAGVLPLVNALVLRRYRHDQSRSLRDRYHVSLVMAALGAIVAVLAAFRLLGINLGEVAAIPLSAVLLAVDILSGKWLWEYATGKFR